ncbi:MAG: hypothetical protein HYZ73_08675, partial [Elusimicrobia bacterium]|nr:hypothetical protein [Elusimicrobiota bacterium]
MTYGLADGSKPHAVTSTSAGWTLQYDANGNMIKKTIDARPQTSDVTPQYLSYDAENRLVEVTTAQEQTVTVRFEPGWNFFSLPVIPDDTRITSLLPTFGTDFESVARYTPDVDHPYVGNFEFYVGDPKFDDFTNLEYGQGYQVLCKNPSGVSITLKGRLPTQQASTSLSAKWHLLPAIALESKPTAWLLQGVAYDQVHAYDAVSQQLAPTTQVQPNQAHYVHVTTSGSFRPPLPKDVTTKFVYDGDGGKVKQITASGTTAYVGDLFEQDPSGKTTKYIFAGGLRVAAKTSTGEWFFYHPDHLGSSNVVTDATGAVV